MAHLTRGELARQSEVSLETLRYYEQRGLIPKPPRSHSNYRLYPEEAVRRVRFIKPAQGLGFTLKEIHELLVLRAEKSADCADVLAVAQAKIDDIDAKIHELQAMREALTRVASTCKGRGSLTECPILDALDPEEEP